MLHHYILFLGLTVSLIASGIIFHRIYGTEFYGEQRLLSVVFGIVLFGLIETSITLYNGVVVGPIGLIMTIQEWLIIVSSLLACHNVNDRFQKYRSYNVY